jgi:dolichol-phosphate mannosyltransferase
MALRKSILNGIRLDATGWKIVLEVVVKVKPRIAEIPIVFSDRKSGRSKLDFETQLDYVRHLWRLYRHSYPILFQFSRFCQVGLLGIGVDTIILVALVEIFSLDPRLAAVFAFFAAVNMNYALNRLWTFKSERIANLSRSYLSFIAICLFGLGIRVSVMHLLIEYANMAEKPYYILASFLGILAATLSNFLGSKYISFRTPKTRT